MGFLTGVKRCSSRVASFSRKLKSKTPGFLKGLSRYVPACSRESKSSESPEKPKQKQYWMNVTLEVKNGKWLRNMDKLMEDLAGEEGLQSYFHYNKDEKDLIQISGVVNRRLFMRRLQRYVDRKELHIQQTQIGNCSSHLIKKKEGSSTKITNPSTNNAIGYYQPQVYGSYYGNGGYSNAVFYGNGAYGNGGYYGNSYNYQPEPATYQRRVGYDHIDCTGNASECSHYHNEKTVTQDNIQDKSSEDTVPKPAGSRKRN